MTIPTATITLDYNSGDTVVIASPMPAYPMSVDRAQAFGRTADGTYYVYDKETMTYTLTLRCELTASQWTAFKTWFDTKAKGMLNTWDLTDHLGNSYVDCRFADPRVVPQKTRGGRYRVTLRIITPSGAA